MSAAYVAALKACHDNVLQVKNTNELATYASEADFPERVYTAMEPKETIMDNSGHQKA